LIRFECHNCGRIIKVRQELAGKKGKCPDCKTPLVVPQPIFPTSAPKKTRPVTNIHQDNKVTDRLFEKPFNSKEDFNKPGDALMQYGYHDKTVPLDKNSDECIEAGKRKLIWFLDIFLYPLSPPGITIIAIVILPVILGYLLTKIPLFGIIFFIVIFVIRIIVGLYMVWYIALCIRDSALGGLRAPETINEMPGLGDLLSQTWQIIACYGALLAPAIIYRAVTQQQDFIWQVLFYPGIFLFPMSLLSVVMHDNILGLNPLITLSSIFKTFFPYCGLVAFLIGIFCLMNKAIPMESSFVVSVISQIAGIYLFLVCAHLLGRLFWRYKDKLDWVV